MDMKDYLAETLAESFEEHGVKFNSEQIEKVAEDVALSCEMYSESTGQCNIPDPRDLEIEELKKKHKQELEEIEERDYIWRESLAKKLGTDAGKVYQKDGKVMYDLR